MKNGRFELKDKIFSKKDRARGGGGNCSYSSFVTLIFGLKTPIVTRTAIPNAVPPGFGCTPNQQEDLAWTIAQTTLAGSERKPS